MRHLILFFKKSDRYLPKLLVISLLFGDELLLLLLPFASVAFPPLLEDLLLAASACEGFKIIVEKIGNILPNKFWKSLPFSSCDD